MSRVDVLFATPVRINTTDSYVAAYHTDAGDYPETDGGFQVQRVLAFLPVGRSAALAGVSGSYAYGPSGTFPDQTFHSANYWIDVIFFPDGQVG